MRFIILCLALFLLTGQQLCAIPKIRLRAQLKIADYPWWPEMYLHTVGAANSFYENATITFSIFYSSIPPNKNLEHKQSAPKHRVSWFHFVLTKNKNTVIKFKKKWGPLNGPAQQIIPGRYEVHVQMIANAQNNLFRKRWQKRFGKLKPVMTILKTHCIIESKKFTSCSLALQKFYLQQIIALNNIFADFKNKRHEVLRIPSDLQRGKDNFFIMNEKFAFHKWQKWLRKLLVRIKNVENSIDRNSQMFYPLRYPLTHASIKSYCDLLLRAMQIAHTKIFKRYVQKKRYRRSNRLDILNFSLIVRTIQSKQIKIARELGIPQQQILVHQ